MSIHNLYDEFTKTQKKYHKKNDMAQSYHFLEIATVIGKVLKKKSRLFAMFICNTHDTHDENCGIVILCCDTY